MILNILKNACSLNYWVDMQIDWHYIWIKSNVSQILIKHEMVLYIYSLSISSKLYDFVFLS